MADQTPTNKSQYYAVGYRVYLDNLLICTVNPLLLFPAIAAQQIAGVLNAASTISAEAYARLTGEKGG